MKRGIDYVDEQRRRLGWKSKDLSERTGIPAVRLSTWRGSADKEAKGEMTIFQFQRCAKAFGMTTSELLGEVETQSNPAEQPWRKELHQALGELNAVVVRLEQTCRRMEEMQRAAESQKAAEQAPRITLEETPGAPAAGRKRNGHSKPA